MRRLQRVNALIKKEVSHSVEKYTLDHNMGFITITGAEVSSSLRNAKIFFTVHNSEYIASALELLNNVKGLVQKHLAQRIRLKYTPKLSFIYDDTLERYQRIEGLLSSIEKKDEKNNDEEGIVK